MTAGIVAIVGATATGKSELGEAIAALLDGEVVCLDARQLFVELEIGTGKPSPSARAGRPHHLFDALHLGDDTSAGRYARLARAACEGALGRSRWVILVGGSGLYLKALQEGLHEEPPKDPQVRARLRAERARIGPEAMHARLERVDPWTASRLHPADGQRIERALEVYELSGQPLSAWHDAPRTPPLAGPWWTFEVRCPTPILGERIARRTREMFATGLIEETAGLRERGLEPQLRALAAIGYDEALDVLAGVRTRAQAEERTSQRTRQLAKRQRTWFRHQVKAEAVELGPGAAAAIVAHVRRGATNSIA